MSTLIEGEIMVTTKDSWKVAIETKYLGPTNIRGSRVKATAQTDNQITLTWDDSLNSSQNHAAAAAALCKKMGWEGSLVGGGTKTGEVFVFVD